MFSNLVKSQPDWHMPINANFAVAEDKMTLQADCSYDQTDNVYILEIRNIPQTVTDDLPFTLPDFFSIMARFPHDYVYGAVFRVGSVDFEAKYAEFEAGDVLTILFDKAEEKCFFKLGGIGGATLAAYAGRAYVGFSFLG
jgi:hypothetical protein